MRLFLPSRAAVVRFYTSLHQSNAICCFASASRYYNFIRNIGASHPRVRTGRSGAMGSKVSTDTVHHGSPPRFGQFGAAKAKSGRARTHDLQDPRPHDPGTKDPRTLGPRMQRRSQDPSPGPQGPGLRTPTPRTPGPRIQDAGRRTLGPRTSHHPRIADRRSQDPRPGSQDSGPRGPEPQDPRIQDPGPAGLQEARAPGTQGRGL